MDVPPILADAQDQGFREIRMFSLDRLAHVATAAVGALVLSTLSITAAVGPVRASGGETAAYASAGDTMSANV
jgi:hypothetical protein